MNKLDRLRMLKKLKERKDIPISMRLDQEEPETNKEEDSLLLKDIQLVDRLIGESMKQASRQIRLKFLKLYRRQL